MWKPVGMALTAWRMVWLRVSCVRCFRMIRRCRSGNWCSSSRKARGRRSRTRRAVGRSRRAACWNRGVRRFRRARPRNRCLVWIGMVVVACVLRACRLVLPSRRVRRVPRRVRIARWCWNSRVRTANRISRGSRCIPLWGCSGTSPMSRYAQNPRQARGRVAKRALSGARVLSWARGKTRLRSRVAGCISRARIRDPRLVSRSWFRRTLARSTWGMWCCGRSAYGCVDGHDRCVAAGRGQRPDQATQGARRRGSSGVHLQRDGLRHEEGRSVDLGSGRFYGYAWLERVGGELVYGEWLRWLGVQAEVRGLHVREDVPREGRESRGEADLPHGCGVREYRQGQGRSTQTAPLQAHDAAEGVYGRGI